MTTTTTTNVKTDKDIKPKYGFRRDQRFERGVGRATGQDGNNKMTG